VGRIFLILVLVAGALVPAPASARAAPAAASCVSSIGPGIPPPARVPAGIPGFHAAWYGQSGYMRLCPGERANAVVAYYNTGSRGWVAGRMGEVAYLGTHGAQPGQDQPSLIGGDGQRGSPATGWPRYDRVAVQPHAYVGPGQVAWFQFAVRAPQRPGTYRLGIRPVVEGATWLEDYGVFWELTVLNEDGTAPAPTPNDPRGFTFTVEQGVLASDIVEAHEGVGRVAAHLRASAGGDRATPAFARILVGDGSERYCCIAAGDRMDIVTGHLAWRAPSAAQPDTWTATTERIELAGHEYVHLWQHALGGNACMLTPRWLAEGMAESLAYRALTSGGLVDAAALDRFARRQLTSGRYVTLRSLEVDWPADANPFAVGYLAVDRLLAQGGLLALRDWCGHVGAASDWRAAFHAAFGESVDSFYTRFEEYRAAFVAGQ
jgi:hypothetical protein